uniref:Uncharacterized protein n=1 Tax=Rhizophora mucronata TaxID=61149 RepID=A0A2P2Q1D7_RHIMU
MSHWSCSQNISTWLDIMSIARIFI